MKRLGNLILMMTLLFMFTGCLPLNEPSNSRESDSSTKSQNELNSNENDNSQSICTEISKDDFSNMVGTYQNADGQTIQVFANGLTSRDPSNATAGGGVMNKDGSCYYGIGAPMTSGGGGGYAMMVFPIGVYIVDVVTFKPITNEDTSTIRIAMSQNGVNAKYYDSVVFVKQD